MKIFGWILFAILLGGLGVSFIHSLHELALRSEPKKTTLEQKIDALARDMRNLAAIMEAQEKTGVLPFLDRRDLPEPGPEPGIIEEPAP